MGPGIIQTRGGILVKRRPRVLHVVSHFALGGAERIALTLSQALQEEFEFSVFAVRGKIDDGVGQNMMDELQAMNVPLFEGPRIPMRYGGMLTGAWTLAHAIKKINPDLVHLHTEVPESSYAVLAALSQHHRQRPVLRTIHNTNFWTFHWRMGQWCDRQLDAAVCVGVSQGAQREMLRLRGDSGGSPLSPEPAIVLNGVPASLRAKQNWQPGKTLRLLFGGRLEYEKGADLIPDILRQTILPAGYEGHLDLFGDGDLREDLEDRVTQQIPGWTINLQPPVADFRERMADYDILIMPSRFEGLPLTAAEAAMAGLPVVATQAPGSVEALPPDHPWMAQVGDAKSFANCLNDAFARIEEWPEIARSTRSFAEDTFSIDRMAQDYAKLYRNLAVAK